MHNTNTTKRALILGVWWCTCWVFDLRRKKVIRSQSAKNGLILYEDFELRNEVTVTFPIEGIFQNFFNFKLPHTHSITPATWHNINLAEYRPVAPTQTRSFSSVPPYAYGVQHHERAQRVTHSLEALDEGSGTEVREQGRWRVAIRALFIGGGGSSALIF